MTAVQTDSSQKRDTLVDPAANLFPQEDRELLRRFAAEGDARAFEVLVQRHGPMVLAVCRRMLRDTHAADDAFQATFLVLLRRAASIRNADLLGNWLYGVAYRVATRARVQAARRYEHESRIPIMSQNDVVQEAERREFQAALDEELNRLPRNYREPFVLCYLQDKTQAEAARLLRCPVGSISGRLAVAREKIRSRLSRRGLALSASAFPAFLLRHAASCDGPSVSLSASVRSVTCGMALVPAVEGVSSNAHRLAQMVLREMELEALKKVIVGLVAAFVICLLTSQAITYLAESSVQANGTVATQADRAVFENVSNEGGSSATRSQSTSAIQPGRGTTSEVRSVANVAAGACPLCRH